MSSNYVNNEATRHVLEPLLEDGFNENMDIKDTNQEPIGYRPVPTDGGWGWMVVLGAFLIHVFVDGFIYSFGVLSVELIEAFDEGRALTSWVVSVMIGLYLGAGPLAGAMTDRYGCRFTTFMGALISSFGCAISYWATSVMYLMVSVGILMGIGFCLMYCPAIVIVTMNFERQRAFATGIAVCGAGVGTFLFAPLSHYLVEEYTWRGAFLIYAGIILNGAVCAMLFRPVQFSPIYEEDVNYAGSKQHSTPELNATNGGGAIPEVCEAPNPVSESKRGQGNDRTQSHMYIDRAKGSISSISKPLNSRSRSMHSLRRRAMTMSTGYLHVKDAFYPGSVTQILDYKRDGDMYRSILPESVQEHDHRHGHYRDGVMRSRKASFLDSQHTLPVDRSVLDIVHELDNGHIDLVEEHAFITILKKLCNLPMLCSDPLFLVYCVSNFLTSVGLNPPLLLLPDMAKQMDIDPTISSLCLSAFGIANTVGRLIFGYLCDKSLPCNFASDPIKNRLWIYNILITLCGISTVICIWATNWVALLVYSAFFGFTLSAYICLTSVLLVDFIGMDKLTSGFGILMLFQGIASFIGAPIAGLFVDITGVYDLAFVFSGVAIALSAIMLYFVPCLQINQK